MLRRLEAHDFRNLEPLAWEPGPGRHLLLGGNGTGKTSLLEAVYAVATTRSFRTPRLAECVRHGAGGFRLVAEVETAARATLAVSYDLDGSGGLDRSVNGERGPLADHLEVLPVVAWSTADSGIVSGPPSERRRFLDRGVVSLRPGALAALRRYRDALREKRELLTRSGQSARWARPGRSGIGGAPGILETWNRVLAEAAVEVARLRAAYAEELGRRVDEVLGEVRGSGIPFPEVTLRYRPSPAEAREGADALTGRLDRAADSERRRGMPLLGAPPGRARDRLGRAPSGPGRLRRRAQGPLPVPGGGPRPGAGGRRPRAGPPAGRPGRRARPRHPGRIVEGLRRRNPARRHLQPPRGLGEPPHRPDDPATGGEARRLKRQRSEGTPGGSARPTL